MKKLLPFCVAHLFVVVCSAQSLNQCEGPYVEYRKNQVIVRAIDADNKVTIDTFPVSEKEGHPVTIHFSNHTDWDFSVPFQKTVITEPFSWSNADRIIAFSDIEGEFDSFRGLLIANKVMDEKY